MVFKEQALRDPNFWISSAVICDFVWPIAAEIIRAIAVIEDEFRKRLLFLNLTAQLVFCALTQINRNQKVLQISNELFNSPRGLFSQER
jgi:hypothetical protein